MITYGGGTIQPLNYTKPTKVSYNPRNYTPKPMVRYQPPPPPKQPQGYIRADAAEAMRKYYAARSGYITASQASRMNTWGVEQAAKPVRYTTGRGVSAPKQPQGPPNPFEGINTGQVRVGGVRIPTTTVGPARFPGFNAGPVKIDPFNIGPSVTINGFQTPVLTLPGGIPGVKFGPFNVPLINVPGFSAGPLHVSPFSVGGGQVSVGTEPWSPLAPAATGGGLHPSAQFAGRPSPYQYGSKFWLKNADQAPGANPSLQEYLPAGNGGQQTYSGGGYYPYGYGGWGGYGGGGGGYSYAPRSFAGSSYVNQWLNGLIKWNI
jgi:hypothetical protein